MLSVAACGGEEPFGDAEGDHTAAPGSVEAAMFENCTTASVRALSEQIVAEANCLVPDAFESVPTEGGITFADASVFPFLQKDARDALVLFAEEHPTQPVEITSMLRTVAQQYMLHRWYTRGTCGIGLAAEPGESNHEEGLAIDTSNYSSLKTQLDNYGYDWMGSSDPVHFTFISPDDDSLKGLTVKAFQRLWNRNHPSDKIVVDGEWGENTKSRLKKAPSSGFPMGASCG